jgi:Transmembrane domain of unknown function (DUF3566)
VNGAEEDGVENRAEPSLAPGKTVLGDTPADSEDADGSPAAESTSAGAEAPQAPSAEKPIAESAAAAPSSTPTPGPSEARPYPSQNGSSATSESVTPRAGAAGPPVTSLMAPPPSAPGGGPSIQDSAMAAMATAASGARGVAARIGASFSSLTKPRSRPPGFAGRPQAAPPRPAPWAQSAGGPRAARQAPPPGPQPRTALLNLQRIEPLSVMKFSSLLSLVGFIVLFVAVAVVWYTLNKLGVFHKIEDTIGLVTYTKNHPGSNAAAWFSAKRVLGYTALIGAINAVLFTALATIGAALYNLVTSLTGGIEVTLKETD